MQVIKRRARYDRCGLILLLALLVILPRGTLAQRLPLKTYTTADGLWNSAVSYIMRDSHGFLWFCTRDGLSRFDGYRFVNYKIPAAADPNVTYMLETRRGVYWIVTNSGGLYRYDPRSQVSTVSSRPGDAARRDGRTLLNAELMAERSFRFLYEDSSGNLWAAADGMVRIEENGRSVRFRPIDLNLPPKLQPDFIVTGIREGRDGSLWLSTNHGLLRRAQDGRVVHYSFLSNESSQGMTWFLVDKDGRIWIGHRSAFVIFQPGPFPSLSPLFISRVVKVRAPSLKQDAMPIPAREGEAVDASQLIPNTQTQRANMARAESGDIWAIYQQSSGRIWTSINGRVHFLSEGRFWADRDLPLTTGAFPFTEDLDGDLWMSGVSGPVRVSLRGFKTYGKESESKPQNNIPAIAEDGRGVLHMVGLGTDLPGRLYVSQLIGNKFHGVHPNLPSSTTHLWTSTLAFLDHTGQWWIATREGLYRFSRVRRFEDLARARPSAVYTERNGLPSRAVYCIFEDSKGDLWISTRRHERRFTDGLVHWERSTETFHAFTEAEGLPPGKAAGSFAEDKAGNLWFGFYGDGGLARYSKGHFVLFTPEDGLPRGFITALHVDRLGRLWLTSAFEGLARIDDPASARPHIISYAGRQGMHANARCVTEDAYGRIYIGTAGTGIDRLTPESGNVMHYGAADGLAAEFVESAYRDHNGALWFGTRGGLSRLDPEPDPALTGPSPLILAFRISGSEYPVPEYGASAIGPLQLNSSQDNLEADFSSVGHSMPLRYQYKFEGRDDDWQTINQPSVHFERLAPGGYQLRLRVQGVDGNSPPPAVITFTILAPIWQRWWFLTLIAAMMTAIAVALYRYRVAHLLALERVRTRIASDLHDDIGSSLSQIAILSEVARLGPEPKPGLLSEIAAMSRELIDSMSDIVWTIKPENDHLSNLIFRMRRFATDVLGGRNIALQFHSTVEDRHLRTNTEMRREVYLIFKEAINNIARHSGARRVRIELEVLKEDLILRITDNGCGFDTVSSHGGNGLRHMMKRAAGLGGKLELRSSPGEGATVTLMVPVASMRTLPRLIAQ